MLYCYLKKKKKKMNIDNINGIFFITLTAAFREQPILGTLLKAGY